MSNKLFVGNLSFATTEIEVLDLFKKTGPVRSCKLIMDKFTNKSRGFAFVEMESAEDATNAIAELDGKEFSGRPLKINEARPREDRPREAFAGSPAGARNDRWDDRKFSRNRY